MIVHLGKTQVGGRLGERSILLMSTIMIGILNMTLVTVMVMLGLLLND